MTEQHDLTSIRVALARIEERQEANLHKVKNLDMKIDAIGVKLDKYVEKEDLDPIRDRLKQVEGTQSVIVRSAVGGAAVIGGGLYAFGKKFGILS